MSRKICVAICLVLWTIQVFIAAVYSINGTRVHPVIYLLSTLALVLCYARELEHCIREDDEDEEDD